MGFPFRAALAWLLLCVLPVAAETSGDEARDLPVEGAPSIREVLSLNRVGSPTISPDGSAVAYAVRATDWEENSIDGEIWLARRGEEPFQLTRTADGSSSGPVWSPDGSRLAFLADRGHGHQVQVISTRGGEARPLTRVQGGVEAFLWTPDGRSMVLRVRDAETADRESEREAYGRFRLESRYAPSSHLWWIDVGAALEDESGLELDPKVEEADAESEGEDSEDADEDEKENAEDETPSFRRLTGGDMDVGSFDVSPDGRSVVFTHRARPDIIYMVEADLSVVTLPENGQEPTVRPLVTRAGLEAGPTFSPDGKTVAFVTSRGETAYYKNSYIATVPADGGEIRILTGDHDGSPTLVGWTPEGIVFVDWQRTERRVHRLDPESAESRVLEHLPAYVWDVDLSSDGRSLAISGQTQDDLAEIRRCGLDPAEPCAAVTDMGDQVAGWPLGSRRIERWKSRDGLEIEGVLHLPDDFDPKKEHPLLVIVHGGPASVSYPDAVPGYVYPVLQWLAKGAVILMPNYRGSDGYGEAFRAANVDKLGIGDAWDVLSGVDHLVEQGFVDEKRMGVMGWSQGGYISAFLATTSDRFQGISVGAGISNWVTYYTNTDITPFTLHYLSATPWDDPKIYADTSPMTFIRQAKTPTLIQHGENDRRVPVPNAFELHRGLEDMGVQTELILYEDLGHGISRPKERLAAALHNWRWFAHTVWGEPLDLDLSEEDLSEEDPSEDSSD